MSTNKPVLFIGGTWDGELGSAPTDREVMTPDRLAGESAQGKARYLRVAGLPPMGGWSIFALEGMTTEQVMTRLVEGYRNQGEA